MIYSIIDAGNKVRRKTPMIPLFANLVKVIFVDPTVADRFVITPLGSKDKLYKIQTLIGTKQEISLSQQQRHFSISKVSTSGPRVTLADAFSLSLSLSLSLSISLYIYISLSLSLSLIIDHI
jgi:hypothetical protein